MPVTPQMLEMANLFRAQLLARERQAATAMVRYYGTTWQRIQVEAMRLEADAQAIRDAGGEVSEARIWQMERMQALQRQTEQELAKFAPFADSTIQAGQREAIAAAQRQAPQLLAAAFPRGAAIDVQFGRMHTEAIEALIGVMQDGSPLLGVLEKYVGDASARMQSTLVTDIALGFGPRKVAADIRREFGMGLSDALRLSRTEQLRAYRTATLASYQANPIVKGWERAAALDDRTCMACLMLDGTLYSTQDEMDDHVQGRCVMLPHTMTYREMGLDVDEPDFSRELGKDWFERQDEATQRAMMGPGKFEAWKAGQFKLEDIPVKIESNVWGNSWVPRSLRDLAPGWTRAPGGEVVGQEPMEEQWIRAIRDARGMVLDTPDTTADRMTEWLDSGFPSGMNRWDAADFAKNEIVTKLSEQTGIPYDDVSKFIHQWAESSNDEDMRSLAMQQDAAKILGMDLPQWQADKVAGLLDARQQSIELYTGPSAPATSRTAQEAEEFVRNNFPEYFPLLDSDKQQQLLRAMYDNTQERLNEAGIGDTIRLRRGMSVNMDIVEEWERQAGVWKADLLVSRSVDYHGSILESWSTDSRTANAFSNRTHTGQYGVVVEMDIPRERLIGSARTGYGCLNEAEFVHLGAFNDERARIVKIEWRR